MIQVLSRKCSNVLECLSCSHTRSSQDLVSQTSNLRLCPRWAWVTSPSVSEALWPGHHRHTECAEIVTSEHLPQRLRLEISLGSSSVHNPSRSSSYLHKKNVSNSFRKSQKKLNNHNLERNIEKGDCKSNLSLFYRY